MSRSKSRLGAEYNKWLVCPHVVDLTLWAMDPTSSSQVGLALLRGTLPAEALQSICRTATAWAVELVHRALTEAQRLAEHELSVMEASGRIGRLPG